jgi:hypothetical protein
VFLSVLSGIEDSRKAIKSLVLKPSRGTFDKTKKERE